VDIGLDIPSELLIGITKVLYTSSRTVSFSKALYFPLDMKKAPLTVAGFIISPVYRKGSISVLEIKTV
jgi:hypothetical protein